MRVSHCMEDRETERKQKQTHVAVVIAGRDARGKGTVDVVFVASLAARFALIGLALLERRRGGVSSGTGTA